jgi:hypothetical protein
MIPVNEETKKTHKSCFQVKYNLKVCKPDGTVIDEKSGENSLVAAFAAHLASLLTATDGTIQEHDITNTLRTTYQLYWTNNMFAGFPVCGVYGVTTVGIVVGTNNTAVTADDYKLNTITAQGSGANQLMYLEGANSAVVTSAPTSSFTVDRVMLNHSGGTITIKELGMYTQDNVGGTWCLCRDIIADPGTDIPDAHYMFVKYTITITT